MEKSLLQMAKEASEKSYSPYSGYKVGAALETEDGKIFTGTNVENSSYSLSMCAERVALFKAVSQGYMKFKSIAVYVDSEKSFPPCGSCRQVLSEFSGDLEVIYASNNNFDNPNVTSIDKLLPESFKL